MRLVHGGDMPSLLRGAGAGLSRGGDSREQLEDAARILFWARGIRRHFFPVRWARTLTFTSVSSAGPRTRDGRPKESQRPGGAGGRLQFSVTAEARVGDGSLDAERGTPAPDLRAPPSSRGGRC